MPFDEQINHYLSSVEIEIPFLLEVLYFFNFFPLGTILILLVTCPYLIVYARW